jgi:hypothetical protein
MTDKNKLTLFFICILLSILYILLNDYSPNTKTQSNFSKPNDYVFKLHISKRLNTACRNLKDQKDFFKDQIEAILTSNNYNRTMINRKEFLQKIEAFSFGFNERSKYA